MGFLISYLNVGANSLWIKLNSPTSSTLRNCSFVDAFNGWAAGDDGIIIHTSNGGNTFEIQNSTISFYINDIFFINKRLGWVVANEFLLSGTTILQTTNGGVNWVGERFPDSTKIFRTIFFLDSLNGYLGGFAGAIYKTTNAGNTWTPSLVDTSEFSGFPIAKFAFPTSDLGFACGGYIDIAGIIWRTTNGGLLWTADNYSPEPFYDFFIKDSQNAIAAGGDFEYGVQISKTSNAGFTWNYSSLKIFGQAYSIDFRTPKEAWMALGFAQSWAVSYDSGSSWVSIPATDSAELYSVTFSDSLHGWAVGNNGVIFKYVPNKVQINNFSTSTTSSYYLFQNYPNPFNPNTVISYQLPASRGEEVSSYVSIQVYDAIGKKIAEIVNEKQNTGFHSIEFDGSNLPSGIYFYKLTAGDFSQVKKMLLLK